MSKGRLVFWLALSATVIIVCLVWLLSTKGSGCIPGYNGEC